MRPVRKDSPSVLRSVGTPGARGEGAHVGTRQTHCLLRVISCTLTGKQYKGTETDLEAVDLGIQSLGFHGEVKC